MSDGSANALAAPSERGGLRAALAALPTGDERAVLAVVVATSGSTYRKPGALIVLHAQTRTGWLSGGCLEAELELAARDVLASRTPRTIAFNTQSDDDLVFGSASGCRGEIRLLLLPVDAASPLVDALRVFDNSHASLALDLDADGAGVAVVGEQRWEWHGVERTVDAARWSLRLVPSPRVLLLGAGPETAPLIRYANTLGWRVDAVEQRGRWFDAVRDADRHWPLAPNDIATLPVAQYDAAVVMSHHYGNDRDYLAALARSAIGFVGLLGPPARRDTLLDELGDDAERLRPRLHAPVGLRLGGEGPESIALAIVAGLQQWFASAPP